MRPSKRWVCAIIAGVMFFANTKAAFSSAPSDTPSVISARSRGDEVVQIQMRLRDLGYLNYKITGQFGDVTIDALAEFQRVNDLEPDGVAGEQTLRALFANDAKRSIYNSRQAAATPTPKPTPSPTPEPTERRTEKPKDTDRPKDTEKAKDTEKPKDTDKPKKTTSKPKDDDDEATKTPKKTAKPTTKPKSESSTVSVRVKEPAPGYGKLLSWSTVNSMWSRGTTCLVKDFETGDQYYMYRMGGSNHADVEPKTAEDTRIFKRTYGGSWSWDRRAVLVRIDGQWVAGSANGQPHGQDTISGNDMSGQVCIHFLNSRTHVHNAVDPDHKRQILKAAGQ